MIEETHKEDSEEDKLSAYEDHPKVLEMLKDSQDADKDNREAAREAHLFIDKRDGQWEPYWWNANSGRPRYTFDMTGPIVDVVSGEMEQAEFASSITPAGGESTKEDAKLFAGIVRNIEDQSEAVDIYNIASRNMVTCGIDGWKIVQKYIDDDSFEQDLAVEPIANFLDSVWFGPFKKPDASDAKYCFVLESISKDDYKERYGDERECQSVDDSRSATAYTNKADQVTIGNIFYIKEEPRELLQLRSGRVIDAEENAGVLDELIKSGDVVVKSRIRNKKKVCSRLFDGKDWLNEEQETVFRELPVIPIIANYKLFENKIIYRGIVEKLLDPQRVFNYTKSREVEECALAPRAKYWMTTKQAAGHEASIATLNTNADPVQFFNPDQENPGPPQQNGGAQVSPGLATLSMDMRTVFQQSANMFAASMGDNPGLQSGVAIKQLQDKGDTGTIKYFKARERGIARTTRIMVSTIPRVYNKERQMRILGEDGSVDVKTINQPVFDEQSQKMVIVNDLSKGKFSVSCSAGPSFKNRQQETVAAITEIAAVDPTVIQIGSDILFNNLSSPGMDLIAQRKRQQLFQAGLIPVDQMSDEEKQQMQQMQSQPKQPDAATLLATAEINKAQAQADKVRVDAEIAQSSEARANALAQAKIESDQQKFMLEKFLKLEDQRIEQQKSIIEAQNTMAKTLETIKNAIGAPQIIGDTNVEAYKKAADLVNQALDM